MSRHTIPAGLLIFAASLLLSGCLSLSDAAGSVRDRIAAREETRERTLAAAPRATYDALKSAATQMGYRQTRGGPAQGEFEASQKLAEAAKVLGEQKDAITLRYLETMREISTSGNN